MLRCKCQGTIFVNKIGLEGTTFGSIKNGSPCGPDMSGGSNKISRHLQEKMADFGAHQF